MPESSAIDAAALRRALGAEAFHELESASDALAAAAALRAGHMRLWALEDRARSRLATDAELAVVKRGIDAENGARHRLIDAIDAALARLAGARSGPEPSLRRYSETLGELCDRLVILDLKLENVARLAADFSLPDEERTRCQQRLTQQERWREHLQRCLAEQFRDHAAGRALLAPRAELKLYNEPLLNPVTRAEAKAEPQKR